MRIKLEPNNMMKQYIDHSLQELGLDKINRKPYNIDYTV